MKKHIKALPLIAIIGRPNVGKSTLFNKLAGKNKSITLQNPCITRDRIFSRIKYNKYKYNIVDTGGIIINTINSLNKKILKQTLKAINNAQIILFIVDVQYGFSHQDKEIAQFLKKKINKSIIIVANKSESINMLYNSKEFYKCGLGKPINISAIQGIGIKKLFNKIEKLIKQYPIKKNKPSLTAIADRFNNKHIISIAVIGKSNVGKSSFINYILGENRQIVSERPGTTLDTVDSYFYFSNTKYKIIDTAGIKKKNVILKKI